MLKNYLTIALRSLARRKGYAFINLFGLALGMAACLVMVSFVRHEWSYDDRHGDDVYRVDIRAVTPADGIAHKAGQPLPLAAALASELPEVAAATRLISGRATIVAEPGDSFSEQILFTDAAFFDVFDYDVDAGTGQLRPGTVVLTENAALKYFGDDAVVGRTLEMSFGGPLETFEVIGVAADPPAASTISFDVLAPVESWPSFQQMETSWSSWVANTFVRVTSTAGIQPKLTTFTEAHYQAMIRTWEILQWLSTSDGAFRLELTPVSEIHFRPDVEQAVGEVVNPRYLYVILGLAIVILLVACINFAALSIGRSTKRAREVGLRKVLGAARPQLVRQFWGEALVMSLFALGAGVVLAEAALPLLNAVLGKEIDIAYFADPSVPLFLVALALGTGLIAGAYPAAYLSRFRPADAFRGGTSRGGRNRWIEGLVVLQFAAAIFCITLVLVGSGQLRYMKGKHVGFEDEQVVVVPTRTSDAEESERLLSLMRNELDHSDGVSGVTAASFSFNHDLAWNSFNIGERGHTVYIGRVDPSFLDVLGMQIVDGRGFSQELENGVLVNEALVQDFELSDPVGRTIHDIAEISEPRVVGVVRDFHFQSMQQAIEPAVLFTGSAMPYGYLYVRARPDALEAIASAWRAASPQRPFTYYFLDEDFDRLYRSEEQWQRIVMWAAALTLLIACMGLFGLAAFAAERRTKEIGIRKVLGASVPEVMGLLTKEFVVLVLVAAIVALPAAYLVMSRWLEDYAYRIDIGVVYLAVPALLALAIAVLTVSWNAARAALADPVETLGYE